MIVQLSLLSIRVHCPQSLPNRKKLAIDRFTKLLYNARAHSQLNNLQIMQTAFNNQAVWTEIVFCMIAKFIPDTVIVSNISESWFIKIYIESLILAQDERWRHV